MRPALDAHHVRGRWMGAVAMVLAGVLVAGTFGAVAMRMKRSESVLDRRGRRASALVIGTDERYRWWPDTATLRYEVEGRRYETEVPVDRTHDFPIDARTEIVYDPEDPGHAKPVHGWAPAYVDVTIWAWIILAIGCFVSGRRGARTQRVLRALDAPGSVATTLRVEPFQVRDWWHRWPRHWVALWPVDADPTGVEASLYAPVEDITRGTVVGYEEPVTVLGEPSPGGLVVIVLADRAVWPRGRARGEPPAGTIGEIRGRRDRGQRRA